jgi:hypothetical protein
LSLTGPVPVVWRHSNSTGSKISLNNTLKIGFIRRGGGVIKR